MVFLFANLCSSWPGGKQESTSCRNLAPMLVDIDFEKGGLNHVTLFFAITNILIIIWPSAEGKVHLHT